MAIYNLIVYPKPGRNTPGRGFPDVNVLVKFSRFRFNVRDTPFKEICHAIITPRCGMGTSRSLIGHQIALCAGVVLVRFGASRSLYPHVVETAKRIGKDMLGRLDCFDDFRVGLEVPDEIPNKSLAVHDANSSPRRSSTTHLSSPFTKSVPHDPLAPTTLILYHTTHDFQRGFQKFLKKFSPGTTDIHPSRNTLRMICPSVALRPILHKLWLLCEKHVPIAIILRFYLN